jgi:hypothetical protein
MFIQVKLNLIAYNLKNILLWGQSFLLLLQ